MDYQVKLHGFRISLSEIESSLYAHPAVREAIVELREDHKGEPRLVAYVVPSRGAGEESQDPAANELRSFLAETLPDYSIPAAFVVLKALPLMPNGKVNRRALPAPELSDHENLYVAPRIPTEEMLASIWSEVLQRERIGIHDNFFELGGHSLLATQVIS